MGQLDPPGLPDRGLLAQLELADLLALRVVAEAAMGLVLTSSLQTTLEASNGRYSNTYLHTGSQCWRDERHHLDCHDQYYGI